MEITANYRQNTAPTQAVQIKQAEFTPEQRLRCRKLVEQISDPADQSAELVMLQKLFADHWENAQRWALTFALWEAGMLVRGYRV